MKTEVKTVNVRVNLPEELHLRLKGLSGRLGVTLAQIIEKLETKSIEQLEKEVFGK
jgi:predicted DNA-binding protein